jgi:hypothetical protein
VHCGFPARGGAAPGGRPVHCEQYRRPNHGRCGRRLLDALYPDGLRMRLEKTRTLDPESSHTHNDAIAHAWIRLNLPEVDLREWEAAAASQRLDWKREEIILAMDLYVTVEADSRAIPGENSAEIAELSDLLRELGAYPPEQQGDKYRNPNSVYLKLMDLRAIQAERAHGMNTYSQIDAAVWREFVDDKLRLQAEASAIRARLQEGVIHPAMTAPVMEDIDIEQQHTETFMVSPSGEPRAARRAEQGLVYRYRDYMAARGIEVGRKKYTPAGEVRPIYSDVWVEDRHALIEAKNSDCRDAIRQAIGQLYDYRRFHQLPVQLAVLLPYQPNPDRLDLLRSASIEAIWPYGSGFRDSAHGTFT